MSVSTLSRFQTLPSTLLPTPGLVVETLVSPGRFAAVPSKLPSLACRLSGMLISRRSPTGLVATDDADDVFVSSPTRTLNERRSDRSITVGNMKRLDIALANEDQALRSRSSNLGARHQINGIDAQNLYPPTACVFVAK